MNQTGSLLYGRGSQLSEAEILVESDRSNTIDLEDDIVDIFNGQGTKTAKHPLLPAPFLITLLAMVFSEHHA